MQLDIHQALARTPVRIKGDFVRATHETAQDNRPWNKAQAIFLCTMRENAGFTREKFDIRWRFDADCFYHNRGELGSEPSKIQQCCLKG